MDNVFRFGYLSRDSLFCRFGSDYDIEQRVVMTFTRYGSLIRIFDSKNIGLQLKLRLYEAAICSRLTYGSETWDLNETVCRTINDTNNVMLAKFTGKCIPQEIMVTTCSLNILKK